MATSLGKHATRVINRTRNRELVARLAQARSFWTRFKGLMGRPDLPAGDGLWIVPCADIHSCFMRFEFDALFVGADGRVLAMMHRMRPWRCSRWMKGSVGVLELPAGVLADTGTEVGDQLEFI